MTRARGAAAKSLIAAAFASVLIVGGCASSSTVERTVVPAGASSAATPDTLTIKDFAFSPLTVKVGSAVTVVNNDSVEHSVTSDGVGLDVKVPGGGQATFTAPAAPGAYPLTCDFHSTMSGRLLVVQ
jgi:plastocyanin